MFQADKLPFFVTLLFVVPEVSFSELWDYVFLYSFPFEEVVEGGKSYKVVFHSGRRVAFFVP